MTAALLGGTVAAAFLGVPIYAILGGLALILFHAEQVPLSAVTIEMTRLTDMPSLTAIPLFTFAGYLLAESGAPQRSLDLAEAAFGWVPGGIAVAALVSCSLFTAFTGASGVTIIALGGIIYPLLLQKSYPKNFSLGLVTTSGSLGLLLPPSLPIILYALVAQVSLERLFAAALLPALLLIAALSAYAVWISARHDVKPTKFSWAALGAALRRSLWEIPLPIITIGGIYMGKFTASEAAAIMAFYALVAELFIYKDIRLSELPAIALKSQMLVGAILMVLGCAIGLTSYFIDAQAPARLFTFLNAHVSGRFWFLALLNAFLLVVNMVEIFSAIVLIVPIIVPVAMHYGIDPIHLGVLFLLNLEIGYLTPPMGLNLFLASRRFDLSLPTLYRASLPFWIILIALLAVVSYTPALSLWLPKLFHL